MKRIKVCHIITKLELGGAQQNTLFTVGNLNQSELILAEDVLQQVYYGTRVDYWLRSLKDAKGYVKEENGEL